MADEMKKLKVLDLFCGAGGLSCGFRLAGFDIVGGVDFEPSAIRTHEVNFPGGVNFCGDIREFTNEMIKEKFPDGVDVIIGGPPCQGFSSANMQQKDMMNDPRNKLFMEFIRFVEQLKPKAFMIENVRGILTKDNGFARKKIYELMDRAGYIVQSKVLMAHEYGVPQKRVRAIFVGVRKDLDVEFDFDKLQKQPKVTVFEAIGDLYALEDEAKKSDQKSSFEYHAKAKTKFQKMIFTRSTTLNNHRVHYPKDIVQERMNHVPQGGNWVNVPTELWDTQRDNRHSSAYRRLKEDDVSVTIDTGHMNYFHPIFNRVPTVRESARLQSFPDDFMFEGNFQSQFKQVGNAVPPLLAYAVAKEIKNVLEHNANFEYPNTTVKQDMNIVDLFCGAGGFSVGFEWAGFGSVLALDKWDQAIETYNYNRKNKVAQSTDIYDYNNEMLAALGKRYSVDGIIGGPPCQGYSMVGTRDEKDKRNSLYLQYVRFVEQIKPKFFILENVKGLLTLGNGYFKRDIVERFGALGYNVNYKVLRASEYGVAQNRERVFFVGLRKDIFGEKYFEFPEPNKDYFISTQMAIGDMPSLDAGKIPTIYASEPQNDYQRFLRGECNYISNNDITVHTKQTIDVISKVPDGSSIKNVSSELYKVRNYNAAFKRMNSTLPSGTIDCGHRNYFHYKENRIPTVRESARIQSFPDAYFFTGNKSDQYTQVGNAVPPLLGYALAKQIRKILSEKE